MKKKESEDRCIGCTLGNPFLCRSFAGKAPGMAKEFKKKEDRRAHRRGRAKAAKRRGNSNTFEKAKEEE